ncbi:MAG: hypothetical protein M0025_11735 [Elusimicrobia bacterium]|nr:hypothetical protein [Elusimicrobiota bacterium]
MTRADLLLPAALLALLAGSLASSRAVAPSYPPLSELRSPQGGAGEDMLALALGARRLAADLWFVRLMQYYGTRELQEGEAEEPYAWLLPRKPGGQDEDFHAENGEGRYPEFLPLALHVMRLDPGFSAAGLYAAGSLAFNMDRPAEAEQVLRLGIRYRPDDWKYATLLAAIGYSRSSSPEEVARAIKPLLAEKDCPVMLKQLAAFLDKKAGDYAGAAAVYADIAATSRDAAYVANARRELRLLSGRRGGR